MLGTPGSGKSYAVVNNFIKQQIEKGFSQYIYDFKYPDLSTIAYNQLLNHPDEDIFPILTSYPELENYLSPFMDAWLGGAAEQLMGQIASSTIPKSRKSSAWVTIPTVRISTVRHSVCIIPVS